MPTLSYKNNNTFIAGFYDEIDASLSPLVTLNNEKVGYFELENAPRYIDIDQHTGVLSQFGTTLEDFNEQPTTFTVKMYYQNPGESDYSHFVEAIINVVETREFFYPNGNFLTFSYHKNTPYNNYSPEVYGEATDYYWSMEVFNNTNSGEGAFNWQACVSPPIDIDDDLGVISTKAGTATGSWKADYYKIVVHIRNKEDSAETYTCEVIAALVQNIGQLAAQYSYIATQTNGETGSPASSFLINQNDTATYFTPLASGADGNTPTFEFVDFKYVPYFLDCRSDGTIHIRYPYPDAFGSCMVKANFHNNLNPPVQSTLTFKSPHLSIAENIYHAPIPDKTSQQTGRRIYDAIYYLIINNAPSLKRVCGDKSFGTLFFPNTYQQAFKDEAIGIKAVCENYFTDPSFSDSLVVPALAELIDHQTDLKCHSDLIQKDIYSANCRLLENLQVLYALSYQKVYFQDQIDNISDGHSPQILEVYKNLLKENLPEDIREQGQQLDISWYIFHQLIKMYTLGANENDITSTLTDLAKNEGLQVLEDIYAPSYPNAWLSYFQWLPYNLKHRAKDHQSWSPSSHHSPLEGVSFVAVYPEPLFVLIGYEAVEEEAHPNVVYSYHGTKKQLVTWTQGNRHVDVHYTISNYYSEPFMAITPYDNDKLSVHID